MNKKFLPLMYSFVFCRVFIVLVDFRLHCVTTATPFTQFTEQANKHHQTIKVTAEVSETETNLLDTTVYRDERFKTEHFSTPVFQPAIHLD